jgi:hypothetical protein
LKRIRYRGFDVFDGFESCLDFRDLSLQIVSLGCEARLKLFVGAASQVQKAIGEYSMVESCNSTRKFKANLKGPQLVRKLLRELSKDYIVGLSLGFDEIIDIFLRREGHKVRKGRRRARSFSRGQMSLE